MLSHASLSHALRHVGTFSFPFTSWFPLRIFVRKCLAKINKVGSAESVAQSIPYFAKTRQDTSPSSLKPN
jgi:hypothetical protein